MTEALSTLSQPCRLQVEIRKSRFLAQAGPVDSAEQALAFVHEVSDADATHNCWAYRIGQAYRFSDDGEPGGTAGRPILQAIDSQQLDGVVVVVTRWYGGIKLGAGGLARAYGGTAAECLRVADRVSVTPMVTLAVHVDYADLALLKTRLHELQAEVGQEHFDATGVELQLRLPAAHADDASRLTGDLTRGRSILRRID